MIIENYNLRTTSGYYQFAEIKVSKKGEEYTTEYKTYAYLDTMLDILKEKGVVFEQSESEIEDILKKELYCKKGKASELARETGFGKKP